MEPAIKKVIPIPPGYVGNAGHFAGVARNDAGGPRPVVALAETGPGVYHACVLSSDGRLEFAGSVHPEGQSRDMAVINNLREIAATLKGVVTLLQSRLK